MEKNRYNINILGKEIGTTDGWDSIDELFHMYYDVILTSDGMRLFGTEQSYYPGGLSINYETGVYELYTNEGEVQKTSTIKW
mgnify:CR=1 FL=1